MSHPLVSVVICNYNYEQFIVSAIDSALNQSYSPIEVIVVDDGSTDRSRQIIDGYKDKLSVIHKENGGQVSAYNAGLDAIHGEFVIFLDSDDRLLPNAIEEIVLAFQSQSNVVKVHYRMNLIDANGKQTGGVIPTKLAEGNVAWMMLDRGCLYPSAPGSGNAYRASALKSLTHLPSDAVDKHGADFFAIYGIALLGNIATANGGTPLAEYRVHRPDDRSNLVFGNAARLVSEAERLKRRYRRFRLWIRSQFGFKYALPETITDFSMEKQKFAANVFRAHDYTSGVLLGFADMPTLLRSIVWRPSGLALKVGLIGWAFAVLLLPRKIGLRLARYVCNPASRS